MTLFFTALHHRPHRTPLLEEYGITPEWLEEMIKMEAVVDLSTCGRA